MYLNGHLEDVQTYYADQKPQCGPLQSLVIMFSFDHLLYVDLPLLIFPLVSLNFSLLLTNIMTKLCSGPHWGF
jgi:hypothetical protein